MTADSAGQLEKPQCLLQSNAFYQLAFGETCEHPVVSISLLHIRSELPELRHHHPPVRRIHSEFPGNVVELPVRHSFFHPLVEMTIES